MARTGSQTRTPTFTDSPRLWLRLALPYLEHVVEGVALDRDLAGVLDHAEELLAREAGRRLGARHVLHALVLEGAVDVVGAEVERDRRRRLAEEHPVRLHVREVVQDEARRGGGAEIVGGRRLPSHEPGRPHLVGEGNEREESPRGILLLSEAQEMVHALGERLDVAVEHRRVGLDAERVRDSVDLAPALRVRLARVAEELRHADREDLGPAAGHRLKAGGLEPRERLLRLDPGAAPEIVDRKSVV